MLRRRAELALASVAPRCVRLRGGQKPKGGLCEPLDRFVIEVYSAWLCVSAESTTFALCVEMITDFSQQSVEVRHLSSLLEIMGLSRDAEARKS